MTDLAEAQPLASSPRGPAGPGGALLLDGIVRRWRERTVLEGATVRLAPGEVAWLSGRNGAGKTTLLRIASGLLLPHAGTVRLHGLDPDRDRGAFQRRLGFLAAGDRGLYARLTVTDNLLLWADLAYVPRAGRAQALAAGLARFELEDLAERRVDRLSTGQRQRVRLALAFLHDPDVVLLDEPTASLDEEAQALVGAALAELAARGGAALCAAPAPAEAVVHPTRALRLKDGRVHEA